MTAHSPVVVVCSSKSWRVTEPKDIILTLSKFLLTIIGEVVLEVKSKFCKFRSTEATLIIIFPSDAVPVTK